MERCKFIRLIKDILEEEIGTQKIRACCLGQPCFHDDARKICVLCRILKGIRYITFK